MVFSLFGFASSSADSFSLVSLVMYPCLSYPLPTRLVNWQENYEEKKEQKVTKSNRKFKVQRVK
jgi:hypothetical protein